MAVTREELEATIQRLRAETGTRQDRFIATEIERLVWERVQEDIRLRQQRLEKLETTRHGLVNVWNRALPSRGCQICLADGMTPIRSVTRCNLDCSFCYYLGEEEEYLAGNHFLVLGREVDVPTFKNIMDASAQALKGVCWVFYEPFTQLEKHLEMVSYIHAQGLYQWIYTNGTLCNRENLQELAACGIEELRFNLAATLCADRVLEAVRRSVDLFPAVGLESPMFRAFHEAFVARRREILATGAQFLNAIELHLRPNHLERFRDEGPLYRAPQGYVSPIASRHYTYDLMELGEREEWQRFFIHDCSNATKIWRSITPLRYHPSSECTPLPYEWLLESHETYQLEPHLLP